MRTLIYSRNEQWASLVVDSGTGVSASSPGQLRQLNTDTGLYVGKWININYTNLYKLIRNLKTLIVSSLL